MPQHSLTQKDPNKQQKRERVLATFRGKTSKSFHRKQSKARG
jgi:hypothetical protein